MARTKTFANSGSLLPADLNLMDTDVEDILTQWRPYHRAGAMMITHQDYTNKFTYFASTTTGGVVFTDKIVIPGLFGPSGVFRIDPNDFAGRKRRCRIAVSYINNSTAHPNHIMSFGLYPVTYGTAGGADSIPTIVTTSAMGGSTARLVAPVANGVGRVTSGEFPLPQKGDYMFGVMVTGPNENGNINVNIELETRAASS